MTRVQVYLDQEHLNILDWLAVQSGISRSQALRQTITTASKKTIKKVNPLLKMCGAAGKIPSPKNLARNVDEIYTQD